MPLPYLLFIILYPKMEIGQNFNNQFSVSLTMDVFSNSGGYTPLPV
jgi:hypothetical protein